MPTLIGRQAFEGRFAFRVPEVGQTVTTWYKLIGNPDVSAPALVVLHGGPGAGHDYLSCLTDLYDTHNMPIVFYDQIGGGRSTHFRDKMGDEGFWTIDLFLRELECLVEHLQLSKNGFYVLGHSWGGILAASYAARQPQGLKKLVIASGPSAMSLYVQGCQELLARLPEEIRVTIESCEEKGDYESDEYQSAFAVWASRHVCRLEPWPQPLQDTFAHLKADSTTYLTM
jgi:proline-specific peptidase